MNATVVLALSCTCILSRNLCLFHILVLFLIVDGNWNDWSNFGDCSVSCGAGLQIRNRSCNNPAPAYGGLDCLFLSGIKKAIEEEQTQICTTPVCRGKISLYHF